MNIGIIANNKKEDSLKNIEKVINIIKDEDINIYVNINIEKYKYYDNSEDMIKKIDLLLILGGDGTIIYNSKIAAMYNVPIVAINLGRVGFIANMEIDNINELKEIIYKYKNNKIKLYKRSMLEIELPDNKKKYALNELCINRSSFSKMIEVSLFINNKFANKYRGDGIIIATSTGSTAYSMSAGGPILDPDLENILITPLCSYLSVNYSLVLDRRKEILIVNDNKRSNETYLSVDGEIISKLNEDEKVSVKISDKYISFVEIGDINFYDSLKKKLK